MTRRPLLARDLVDVRDVRLALLRAAVGAVQGALIGGWWGGPYAAAAAVSGLLLVVPAFVEGTARRKGIASHRAAFEWAVVAGLVSLPWAWVVGSQAGWAWAVAAHGKGAWQAVKAEQVLLTCWAVTGLVPAVVGMTFLHLDASRPPHRHGCAATVERAVAGLFALPLLFIYFVADLLERALRRDDA